MDKKGTLHFFCGKMAAGKSTKAKELASNYNAILLSEDDWLGQLYPEEFHVLDDYTRYSARLKPLLKSHVQSLLNAGLSVVMDFPGNTEGQRAWFKEIYSEYDLPHQLHYVRANDELCIYQLKQRSEGLPAGTAFTTEAEFHVVNSHFQPPAEEESFNIQFHKRDNA